MSYALNTVANAFIQKAHESGKTDLTPMKLLKLVYIAHGWSLGLHNQPLFVEKVEAWKFGPVIRDLYHEVKQWGNNPISSFLPVFEPEEIQPTDKRLIDKVWEVYGGFNGLQLSAITHQDNSPWSETWDERGLHGLTIEPDLIRDHYRELVQLARSGSTSNTNNQKNYAQAEFS